MNVDPNLFHKHVPIVYTTRLEDMAVLRNKLSKKKFEDTIEIIIAESKPCYKDVRSSSQNFKPKHSFKSLKLKRMRNMYTKIYRKRILYNTDEIECRNGQFVRNESNNLIEDKPEVAQKFELQTNESKLSLLALCKPVRVVLENIPKKISKETHDEDNVIDVAPIYGKESNTEAENFGSYYTIRNKDEYKDFLINKDLRNSVVVFYNKFNNELDEYEIDETYAVVNCVNVKSARIYTPRIKSSYSLFFIVVCCWKQRQYYFSLLESVERYRNIAKLLYTRSPSQESVCCCLNQNTKSSNNNFTHLEADSSNNVTDLLKGKSNTLSNDKHISPNILPSAGTKTSVLILNALVYKKDSKWKRNPEKLNPTGNKKLLNTVECNCLLKLCNTDGTTEIYELLNGDQIYSKLIINSKNNSNSSWLLQTLDTPRTFITPKINVPLERETQINYIKNGLNISVSNYLRNPTPKDHKSYINKINLPQKKNISDVYSYRVEYIRCFMGAKNKYIPVLAIKPQGFIPEKSVQANNQELCQNLPIKEVEKRIPSEIPVQVDNSIKLDLEAAKINKMNEDVSQCINSIIKNILYKFRDVNLTINSEGKVSASLNAPLSSLSPAEVKMLSTILKCAQSQVDELGLKNKKLNEDTQKLLQPNCSKNLNSNNDGKTRLLNSYAMPHNTIVDDSAKIKVYNILNRKNMSDICQSQIHTNPGEPSISAKIKDISKFSEWVSEKKIWYEKHFRSFLYNANEFNPPKILNVFSLQQDVNQDSEISKDLEGHKNNETDITDIKIEVIDEFTKTKNSCTNEIQQQMCLLDDETKSTVQMERGQKRTLNSSDDVKSLKIKKESGES